LSFDPEKKEITASASATPECEKLLTKGSQAVFQITQSSAGECQWKSRTDVFTYDPTTLLGDSVFALLRVDLQQYKLGTVLCVRGKAVGQKVDSPDLFDGEYGTHRFVALSFVWTSRLGYILVPEEYYRMHAVVQRPHVGGDLMNQVTAYATLPWTVRSTFSEFCVNINKPHKFTLVGFTDTTDQQRYLGYRTGHALRLGDPGFYYGGNVNSCEYCQNTLKNTFPLLAVPLQNTITVCARIEWQTSSVVIATRPDTNDYTPFSAVRVLSGDPHLRDTKFPMYPAVSAAGEEVFSFVPVPTKAFEKIIDQAQKVGLCPNRESVCEGFCNSM